MGLLLAAALAAQIHTGQDLLAACSSADTLACDRFIQSAATASPAACIPPTETYGQMMRKGLVVFIARNPQTLAESADEVLKIAFDCDY
jgi:hypothetical protein